MLALVLLAILLNPLLAQAVVYLCPTDGDGTDSNPFRSRAVSELLPGRGNIDHFRDVTKPGLMLCESDVLPTNMTGVVLIGNERNTTLTAKAKADIALSTTKVIRGTTTEEAIKEMVIPSLPRPKFGDYEIILGTSRPPIKEVASLQNDIYYKGWAVAAKEWGLAFADAVREAVQPQPAHAHILLTETFDCADANPIGTCVHAWVNKNTPELNILSRRAERSGATNYADDYLNQALSTTDQEWAATFVSVTLAGGGSNTTCSITGRNTADANHTYYRTVVTIRSSGELNDVSLVRTVSESSTTLATDTTDWAANDLLAIRMVGTTISTRKNHLQILSATDANITTGNYGGLRYFSDGSSSTCLWDNFNGRDITTLPRKRIIAQ